MSVHPNCVYIIIALQKTRVPKNTYPVHILYYSEHVFSEYCTCSDTALQFLAFCTAALST